MATETDDGWPKIDSQFDRLETSSNDSYFKSENDLESTTYDDEFMFKWGFRLRELYRLALKFYKDKEGKAVNLSYEDRLSLVAYAKQTSSGAYDPSKSPPLGVLDVVGRNRRKAWQALGSMSREEAMAKFITTMDFKCGSFRPFIEAHKADLENRRKERLEEEKQKRVESELQQMKEALKGRNEEERLKEESHKRQIQEALNQQTLTQFQAYVEQQYPGDMVKQENLLKQLQEQHYQQYIDQIIKIVKEGGQVSADQSQAVANGSIPQTNDSDNENEVIGSLIVTEASMWTHKDIKEFKESIRKEGGDSIICVGHGETVTVRVPANEEGTCLFWEFATDYYDIGFGLYFEWTKSPTNTVSVHVSDSEDDDYLNDDDDNDDDDDDDDYGLGSYTDDLERGPSSSGTQRPPLSIIIPVCKRKCQEEVHAGSHAYPGQGVYLLKFDNSYSVLRSKTLYYRVFYTR